MKNITKYYWVLILFIINSCAKESVIPVTADFQITVKNNDYTVPVRIEIENKSLGADSYQWTFEGANITNSNKITPQILTYTQAGNYTIVLEATNRDGERDKKSMTLEIDAAMLPDFTWKRIGSDIAPVTIELVNKSKGANKYHWEFEKGIPKSSNEVSPSVTFSEAGKHLITLTISNGKETHVTKKSIEIKPAMTIDFDWHVDFIDKDYQAPVTIYLENKSTNATSFLWTINGTLPFERTERSPKVTFSKEGTYTITLENKNDKENRVLTKNITILPNKNLLTFNDLKLGINTAQKSIGCFFSSTLGKVFKTNEINNSNGSFIDFAYFGLNSEFNHNQILSPDNVQSTVFTPIINATHTKIINRQEIGTEQLSASQFDLITKGRDFSSISVTETSQVKGPFNNEKQNRIILFETADKRKGAIKIKSYNSDGKNSYIIIDVKVQKKSLDK